MRRYARLAWMGAAALVGALGMADMSARAAARANANALDRVETGRAPTPGQSPAQGSRSVRSYALRTGRDRLQFPAEGIWIGRMRAGGRPVWKVGRRGGNRLRGMGVRV